jgi:mono/diheme cytochrome c family protein
MSAIFHKINGAKHLLRGHCLFCAPVSRADLRFVADHSQAGQPRQPDAEQVARGKKVWEVNNCIGCHTLLGEGAYFAPELGNVYKRRGPEFIKAWIKSQPTGAPGRRQMPNFNLTDQQLNDLVEFLKYSSEINTQLAAQHRRLIGSERS